MAKKFVLFYATADGRVEWTIETAETLLKARFPPSHAEHKIVQFFAETAVKGDFIVTKTEAISCYEGED